MRSGALKAILALSVMVWLMSGTAAAEPEQRQLPPIVAAFNEAPPMAYTNAAGGAEGALVRMAKSLFAVAGIKWSAAAYPAPRLVKGLRDGSFNFSMLVRMPDMEECCLFSSEPVFVQEPAIFFLSGKPVVSRKEDLVGKSLIVINGFSYAGMIRYVNDPANGIVTEVAESLDAALRMLEAGRADYLLSYEYNARAALAAHPVKGIESRIIGHTPVHLVLSRSYPDAAATLARLEAIVKAIGAPTLMAEE